MTTEKQSPSTNAIRLDPRGAVEVSLVCYECGATLDFAVEIGALDLTARGLSGHPITLADAALTRARDVLFDQDWYLHKRRASIVATCSECNTDRGHTFKDYELKRLMLDLIEEGAS